MQYRWHPLYGRAVRRFYSEQRANGAVVHVEASAGNVIVVAAWMLDAAACAHMVLGEPRVSLPALQELKRALLSSSLERTCNDSVSAMEETHRENSPFTAAQAHAVSTLSGRRRTPGAEHGSESPSDRGVGQSAAARRGRAGKGS